MTIRPFSPAILAAALAACSDSSAPRPRIGDYELTVTVQGQKTVQTGHDAAFYRYNYAGGVPADTAMYLFVGDSLAFFQFESPPLNFPAPRTDSVHTFTQQGSTWLTVESNLHVLMYGQVAGEPNIVTFQAVTPDSIVGTFTLTYLLSSDTAIVTGQFNAGPTSTFRSMQFMLAGSQRAR